MRGLRNFPPHDPLDGQSSGWVAEGMAAGAETPGTGNAENRESREADPPGARGTFLQEAH